MGETNDAAFHDLLKSIGISKFDPLVPVALHEYAHRFAVEILSDAKDLSTHASKPEIDVEDILLAVKMNSTRIVGADASEAFTSELQGEVNKQDLVSLADKESVLLRYPPDMFMQRVHTFVPGGEAYPEEALIGHHNNGGGKHRVGDNGNNGEDIGENISNNNNDDDGSSGSGPMRQTLPAEGGSLGFVPTALPKTGPRKLASNAPGFDGGNTGDDI